MKGLHIEGKFSQNLRPRRKKKFSSFNKFTTIQGPIFSSKLNSTERRSWEAF
jgi:hypothetical protein